MIICDDLFWNDLQNSIILACLDEYYNTFKDTGSSICPFLRATSHVCDFVASPSSSYKWKNVGQMRRLEVGEFDNRHIIFHVKRASIQVIVSCDLFLADDKKSGWDNVREFVSDGKYYKDRDVFVIRVDNFKETNDRYQYVRLKSHTCFNGERTLTAASNPFNIGNVSVEMDLSFVSMMKKEMLSFWTSCVPENFFWNMAQICEGIGSERHPLIA